MRSAPPKARRAVLASSALALALMVGPAVAADWYTLAVSDQLLVLTDRIPGARTTRHVSVREVQIYATPHAIAGATGLARRLELQLELDCAQRRLRARAFTAFDEAGARLLAWDADAAQAAWQVPQPASAHAFLMQGVCDGKRDPARLRRGADVLQLQHLFEAAATGR